MSPCTLKMGWIALCGWLSVVSSRVSQPRGRSDEGTSTEGTGQRSRQDSVQYVHRPVAYSVPGPNPMTSPSTSSSFVVELACGIGSGKGRGYSRGGFGQHETCQHPPLEAGGNQRARRATPECRSRRRAMGPRPRTAPVSVSVLVLASQLGNDGACAVGGFVWGDGLFGLVSSAGVM